MSEISMACQSRPKRLEMRVCRQCAASFEFVAYPSEIKRGRGYFCSKRCSNVFNRTGKRSTNWRGGRVVVDTGHIWVYAPGDPHSKPNGYALEHRVIMAGVLGRPLTRREVVHHINGDPADNRPENLQLLPSQSEHMRHHNKEWREAKNGGSDGR